MLEDTKEAIRSRQSKSDRHMQLPKENDTKIRNTILSRRLSIEQHEPR